MRIEMLIVPYTLTVLENMNVAVIRAKVVSNQQHIKISMEIKPTTVKLNKKKKEYKLARKKKIEKV